MAGTVPYDIRIKLDIVHEQGFALDGGSTVLDFGCGSGRTVQELRKLGYDAYGCDTKFRYEDNVDTDGMNANGVIRLIDKDPYNLPFEADAFDFVFSDQVFEHVQNYSESIAQISRVLKPTGCCLHILPSRYKPIEPHLFVPFSTVIRSRWWLHLWARMGVRNEHQRGLSASDTANHNYEYLKNNTNYLPKREIRKHFREYFTRVVFCEREFLKHSRRGRYLYSLSRYMPFLPALYSALRSRVLLTSEPKKHVTG